jgi:nitrogenase-stabilizing/protective protein
MGIVDELKTLSTAEDFFHRLEVEFDPRVLNPARLHILRRMGESLARTPVEGLDDGEARAVFRSALQAAYADFVSSSPLEQRVFKVHKNARRQLLFARAPKARPS